MARLCWRGEGGYACVVTGLCPVLANMPRHHTASAPTGPPNIKVQASRESLLEARGSKLA